jgi:hypothetical protein
VTFDRRILLFEALFEAGLSPLRVSSEPWHTQAGDPDGYRLFPGDLLGDPEFEQRVSCAVWSDRAVTSISAIELNNADGKYDWLLTIDPADARCSFRLATPGQAWDDTTVVFRGIVRMIEVDRAKVRIVLDTMAALLRRPLMTEIVDDSNGREGTSPVWIGQCYQIPPLLQNQSYQVYRFADCGINGVNDILAGGSPFDSGQWDYDAERIGFVSHITTPERVTCNGFGSFGFGDDLITNGDFSAWTAGDLDTWDTVISGVASSTEVPDVGVHLQWEAGDIVRLQTPANTLPDTAAGWYLIKGRIAKITTGLLYCLFRGDGASLVTINQAGDFAIRTYIPAGADRTFWVGSDATDAGDLVLDYIDVRKIGSNQSQILNYAIEQLCCVHGPLRHAQLDQTSINALAAAATKQVGYYQPHGGNQTIADVLTWLLAGWTGYWWIDELGVLKVGRLEAPDQMATPDLSLTDLDIVGGLEVRPDLAPNLSDTYAGRRNWQPYNESEVAGNAEELGGTDLYTAQYRHVRSAGGRDRISGQLLHPTYAAARGREPIETLTSGGDTQVLDEAVRAAGIYQDERFWHDCRASLQSREDALALQPGALVGVTYPRFGLDAGRNLAMIGKRLRLRGGVVGLLLWG